MKFILIIPAVLKPFAESASKQLDPTSLGEDFATPLRTIGSETVTHWANLPNVTDEPIIAAIRQFATAPEFSGGIYHECGRGSVRAQFLELLEFHGLEEMPAAAE